MLMLIFTFRTVIPMMLPSVVPAKSCVWGALARLERSGAGRRARSWPVSIWQSGGGELSKSLPYEPPHAHERGGGLASVRAAASGVRDLPRPQRLHPRQHGVRGQGVARHAA